MKQVGILLPIFSLPGGYGIGDFGKCAYEFINLLVRHQIGYWEVLPIYPTFHSPYSPMSSFSISSLYIDLDVLVDMKLIESIPKKEFNSLKVSYEEVYEFKDMVLRKAFSNIKDVSEILEFKNVYGDESAKFMALYKKNQNKNWLSWDCNYDYEEYLYQLFLNYLVFKQWFSLKKYANERGIKIIGDLPFYVDYFSSDVYFYRNHFLLEDSKMCFVSGCSPDIYNMDGQKWGHPLYDFSYQKDTGYEYLLKRISYACALFDVVRIDHFKGFMEYYQIPIDKGPKDGEWVKGPGRELLDLLFDRFSSNQFIVEDLESTIEIKEICKQYQLIGMKVFEQSFDYDFHNDLEEDSSRKIVYPGNHDNDTIVGWYESLDKEKKEFIDKFLKEYDGKIHEKVIRYLLSQPYQYLVIMVQDLLGLGSADRINYPGRLEGSFIYRFSNFDGLEGAIYKLL